MRRPHYKAMAFIGVCGVLLLVVAFVARSTAVEGSTIDNCQAIEELKAILRPDPIDINETKAILRDLAIEPISEQGQRLIRKAEETNAKQRKDLAPKAC